MSNEHSPLPWLVKEEVWGHQVLDANGAVVIRETAYYPEAPNIETCEFIATACNAHAGLVEALKMFVWLYQEKCSLSERERFYAAKEALAKAGVK